MKGLLFVVFLVGSLISGSALAWDIPTTMALFVSPNEVYKARETLYVIDDLGECSDAYAVAAKIEVHPGAIFKVVEAEEKYWIIKFPWKYDKSKFEQHRQYKFCLAETNNKFPENKKPRYDRIGGITSGVLVVPFKLRGTDSLSGDATVGPYFGFQSERIKIAFSIGLSQIALEEDTSGNVKNETGLTFATGFIYSLNKDFDLALIAGQDRVFGDARDKFEHQGDWWLSFGIGYNFTK